MALFKPNPQKKKGTFRDLSSNCGHCRYGPWGLHNKTTEIRYCQNQGCQSQETRGHSCDRNGCELHPDNQIPGT